MGAQDKEQSTGGESACAGKQFGYVHEDVCQAEAGGVSGNARVPEEARKGPVQVCSPRRSVPKPRQLPLQS